MFGKLQDHLFGGRCLYFSVNSLKRPQDLVHLCRIVKWKDMCIAELDSKKLD